TPIQSQRPRSTAPTACAGLTHTPPWALGAPESGAPPPAPPRRPDPRPLPPRRPRTVHTALHVCPPTAGDDRGWLGRNTLRPTGPPHAGPWRPWHCLGCSGSSPERHGTLGPGTQPAVARSVRVLACLAEGRGLRATARGFAVAPNTGLAW